MIEIVGIERKISGIIGRYRDAVRTYVFSQQKGMCYLCGTELVLNGRGRSRRFIAHLDHNHETNRIRGVLCGRCNLGLSFLEDPDWALRAADYLTRAPFDFPYRPGREEAIAAMQDQNRSVS